MWILPVIGNGLDWYTLPFVTARAHSSTSVFWHCFYLRFTFSFLARHATHSPLYRNTGGDRLAIAITKTPNIVLLFRYCVRPNPAINQRTFSSDRCLCLVEPENAVSQPLHWFSNCDHFFSFSASTISYSSYLSCRVGSIRYIFSGTVNSTLYRHSLSKF